MAYDRYDTRGEPRDERSRWRDERPSGRDWRGGREGRGFFERASDEISSWFGSDDDHRGQRGDYRSEGRHESGSADRDWDRERSGGDWNENRGTFARGGSSDRDYNPDWQRGGGDRDRGFERSRDSGQRGYHPMTGDYGRSEQFFAASGVGRGERGFGDHDRDERGDRSSTPWGRDDYRRTSFAGSQESSRNFDPHYHSWRERHVSELDRDYDDFRREHQSKFESDFATWREQRQQKRSLLSQIREHMEVVGSDDEHVGTVDKVAGDRIILTKSDPESGGGHHSLSCSDVDRVDGERVILGCAAEQARDRWRDESRSRALFERDDQGEMGPRMLDRSFPGTYR